MRLVPFPLADLPFQAVVLAPRLEIPGCVTDRAKQELDLSPAPLAVAPRSVVEWFRSVLPEV